MQTDFIQFIYSLYILLNGGILVAQLHPLVETGWHKLKNPNLGRQKSIKQTGECVFIFQSLHSCGSILHASSTSPRGHSSAASQLNPHVTEASADSSSASDLRYPRHPCGRGENNWHGYTPEICSGQCVSFPCTWPSFFYCSMPLTAASLASMIMPVIHAVKSFTCKFLQIKQLLLNTGAEQLPPYLVSWQPYPYYIFYDLLTWLDRD